MKFIKNYKSTLILLLSMIIGAILGVIFKEDIKVISPFGDLFINMMYIVIVPLVFVTITNSIANMNSPKRMGKIMITIILSFVVTSLVAVLVGVVTTYNIDLIDVSKLDKIELGSDVTEIDNGDATILDRTLSVLTVSDFGELFSKDNIIALLVVSILVGKSLIASVIVLFKVIVPKV